jgi:hypothetical protein
MTWGKDAEGLWVGWNFVTTMATMAIKLTHNTAITTAHETILLDRDRRNCRRHQTSAIKVRSLPGCLGDLAAN